MGITNRGAEVKNSIRDTSVEKQILEGIMLAYI